MKPLMPSGVITIFLRCGPALHGKGGTHTFGGSGSLPSGRCQRYVREERAIAQAREAMVRADQALGDALAPVGGALEPGHELADRTAAVLAAYRELTRDTPSS